MSGRYLRSQRNFGTGYMGCAIWPVISNSRLLPIVCSSHTVSSVARLSWLRMAGAIASLRSLTGTNVSPCEFMHNARTGSERFFATACEQHNTACQKRSGFISACEGAGNSGAYEQACWASMSPVPANTTALHRLEPISMASKLMMVSDSRLALRRKCFRPNCRKTSARGQDTAHCGIPQWVALFTGTCLPRPRACGHELRTQQRRSFFRLWRHWLRHEMSPVLPITE